MTAPNFREQMNDSEEKVYDIREYWPLGHWMGYCDSGFQQELKI